MEKESQRVAVVVVPFPAQGHLNQLLNFCLHLSSLASDHIQVHYVNSPSHIRQVRSRAQGWNSTSLQNIHFHDFPVPPISAPPPDPNSPIGFPSHLQPLFDSFATTLQGHLSSLLRSLSSTCRRVVVVHEPITAFAGHAAKSIPNVESFRFQCIPVFYKLANSTIWHNKWKKNLDTPQAVLDIILTQFDGSVTPEFFEFLSKQNMDIPVEAGTLINTCRLVEGEFIDLLAREEPFCNMKLFAIGPLLPVAVAKQESGSRHWCLDWLDKQPSSSVGKLQAFLSSLTTPLLYQQQQQQIRVPICSRQCSPTISHLGQFQFQFNYSQRSPSKPRSLLIQSKAEGNSSVDIDPSDCTNQSSNEKQLEVARPVGPSSSGKGLPYAPENCSSPGDVWTWKVGKRRSMSGHWLDRAVSPPRHLPTFTGSKSGFYSKVSPVQHIRKEFPTRMLVLSLPF